MEKRILSSKKINIRDNGQVGSNPKTTTKPPQIPGSNKGNNKAK